MSVVSARTFNQSPSKIKAMASDGPVFVTDRGKPTLVVLNMADYQRMSGGGSVLDAVRMDEDIDFEPVIMRDLGRTAQF